MKKVIGTITKMIKNPKEHKYLKGYDLKVIAVLRDEDVFHDDSDWGFKGILKKGDRLEVVPFLEKEGRYSFVSSDPLPKQLEAFKNIRYTKTKPKKK